MRLKEYVKGVSLAFLLYDLIMSKRVEQGAYAQLCERIK